MREAAQNTEKEKDWQSRIEWGFEGSLNEKALKNKKIKNVKKSSKKGIDKGKRMWYNNEAVRKSGGQEIGHWKLNNKRLKKYKAKSIVRNNLGNSERNTTQTKVRRS